MSVFFESKLSSFLLDNVDNDMNTVDGIIWNYNFVFFLNVKIETITIVLYMLWILGRNRLCFDSFNEMRKNMILHCCKPLFIREVFLKWNTGGFCAPRELYYWENRTKRGLIQYFMPFGFSKSPFLLIFILFCLTPK